MRRFTATSRRVLRTGADFLIRLKRATAAQFAALRRGCPAGLATRDVAQAYRTTSRYLLTFLVSGLILIGSVGMAWTSSQIAF